MPNSIEYAKKYIPMLDEVYKMVALTSVLDGPAEMARQGANADELIIPKMTMQGLANYDRNGGYKRGAVTLVNETVKCNFDRARLFSVDNVDNMDTAGVAFARLAGEFIRTQVAPELDAFRFAVYCAASGITKVEETLGTGELVVKALRAAANKMDEDEVPYEERYLFITPTLKGLMEDLDTTKSRDVLDRFAAVKPVPQTRFYTAIEQKNDDEGGFAKAGGAAELNFLAIHKAAVIQFEKHVAPKIITPEQNQHADAYDFGYRNVGIADVYENKVAGIYASHKPAV